MLLIITHFENNETTTASEVDDVKHLTKIIEEAFWVE